MKLPHDLKSFLVHILPSISLDPGPDLRSKSAAKFSRASAKLKQRFIAKKETLKSLGSTSSTSSSKSTNMVRWNRVQRAKLNRTKLMEEVQALMDPSWKEPASDLNAVVGEIGNVEEGILPSPLEEDSTPEAFLLLTFPITKNMVAKLVKLLSQYQTSTPSTSNSTSASTSTSPSTSTSTSFTSASQATSIVPSSSNLLPTTTPAVTSPLPSTSNTTASTISSIKLCSTAEKIRTLQFIEPAGGRKRLWLDSNEWYRNGGIKTQANDPLQAYSFYLTLDIFTEYDFKYIHICTIPNLIWFLTTILPTHIITQSGLKVKYLWIRFWDDLEVQSIPPLARPLSLEEQKIYLLANVVDTSSEFTYGPKSFFVRNYRGLRNDYLVFLSNHYCVLKEVIYGSIRYHQTIKQMNSIFYSIQDLLPRESQSPQLLDELEEFKQNFNDSKGGDDELSGSQCFIRRQYDIGTEGRVVMGIKSGESGKVRVLRNFRTEESKKSLSFTLDQLSNGFINIIAEELLGSIAAKGQARLNLESYRFAFFQNRAGGGRKMQTSWISESLAVLSSKTLQGEGAREKRFHSNQLYSDLDLELYLEALEDESWTDELINKYQLTAEEATSKFRFRIASKEYAKRKEEFRSLKADSPEDHTTLNYLNHSHRTLRADSKWLWTSHPMQNISTTNRSLQFGFRNSYRTNSSRFPAPDGTCGTLQDQCASCSSLGHNCFIYYLDALEKGFISKEVGGTQFILRQISRHFERKSRWDFTNRIIKEYQRFSSIKQQLSIEGELDELDFV